MTITLKNVPPAVHRTLKRQAKLHKRSLNQEAITCLEATLGLVKTDRQALHEKIVKRREEMVANGFIPMTQKQLRAAIDEGRE
jgi:plasmid stability protein